MQAKLEELFLFLRSKKSFYGRLAMSLKRVAYPKLEAIAVGVHQGTIALYYDPEYVAEVDLKTAIYDLEHEMMHLALDHIPRYIELRSQLDERGRLKAETVVGVAADCAVNSLMRDHPHRGAAVGFHRLRALRRLEPGEALEEGDGMHMPERYGLPDKQAFETYQRALMERVDIVDIPFTEHSLWGGQDQEGGGTSDSLIGQAHRLREQIKPLLRAAVESLGGFGRGLLPGDVEEFLMGYLAPPVVPWWQVLHGLAKARKIAKAKRSVSVPNRALMALSRQNPRIIAAPGRTKDRSWRLIFLKDTSGSMASASLKIALNEIHHMLQVDEDMEVRSIDFDAEVHTDEIFRSGDRIPAKVHGRGGTDFNAAFEYIQRYMGNEETEPDLVIVYTDGYAPPVTPENRLPAHVPVLWLVTPQHHKGFGDYGEVLVCDPAHEAMYEEDIDAN